MHNLYTNSVQASLSSFNGYSESCSSSFNGGYPSSSCCCCCCCCCSCNCCSSISINTFSSSRLVPINPSPFYGFMQSTLIQRPPSRRRMILASVAPIGGLGPIRSTYGNLSCIRDVGFDWIRYQGMKSKGKGIGFGGYGGMSVLEERFIFHKVSATCDDAEAIISLLTEELGEEKVKKVSSSKKRNVRECVVDEKSKVRKEKVYAGQLENVEAQGRKEGYRMRNKRKEDYSGSSYCLSSDLSDSERIVTKYEQCTEMGNEKESRKRVGSLAIKEQAKEKLDVQKIKKNQYLESSRRDNTEAGTSGRLELRKKLREESVKESASQKGSVLNQSKLSEAHLSDSHKGPSMKKRYNYRVGESISKVNSSERLKSGNHRKDNRLSETSDSSYKYEHLTGSSGFVDEKTTAYLSKASGSEEHVVSAGEFCRTCGQVTSTSKTGTSNEQQSKLHEIQCNNAGFMPNVETKVAYMQEESSSLMQTLANAVQEQHKQEHLVASNQINSRKSEYYTEIEDAANRYEENTKISRRHAKFSEIQNMDATLASTVRQQSETRIKSQEQTSNLIQTSSKEVNEKSHEEHLVATGQSELMKRNQNRIEMVDIESSIVQDTSVAQQHHEARVKVSEENTVSVSSLLAKEDLYQTGMQLASQKQSRKASRAPSGSSQVHFDKTVIANTSSASEERLHYEQSYLRERVEELHEHVKETVKQTELRYEVQTPLREPTSAKERSRHPYVMSTSQVRIEELGEEEDERNLHSGPSKRLDPPPQPVDVKETHELVKEAVKQTELRYEVQVPLSEPSFVKGTSRPPYVTSSSQVRIEEIGEKDDRNVPWGPLPRLGSPPQFIEVHPVYVESAITFASQDSCRNSGGESSICIDPQSADSSCHIDLLESAQRMDSSCHLVTDDCVEKTRHEESTSVTDMEKKLPERQLLGEGVEYRHMESVQSDSEISKFRKESSSHFSGSFTGDEPSDVTLRLGQPRVREQSENSETPQNGLVRRSGRGLWNVLANIVRLQWGLPVETRTSTVKTGGQSSLSDSTGSEALSSGHAHEVAQGGMMEIGALRTSLEPSSTYQPLVVSTPTQSPTEGPTILNTGENTSLPVDSILPSSSAGISGETNIELIVDKMRSEATMSMNWSQYDVRLRGSHRRSDAIYELHESGEEATGSGTVDQIKGESDPNLSVVSSSEENAAELRRGKLLRSNQFMQERFDEWEEAYRLESEQRKIDQTFMREALEEAKKAAGLWEVPVGAVLVQDGKIVARGHNLVEDLRDSTAHAEIICIREASRILKTWRLSETTLYVTLEPCAMCAGAILQARIGTLVYGAPNKLVGADGSWVRLFPGSVYGEGGSESTSKPEGPVHPFHPKMTIRRGILEVECGELLQQSFKLRKKKGKETKQHNEQRSNKKLHNPSKLLRKMHHRFHILFSM